MTEHRCGCCEGIEALTPLPTANRPGLPALRYRVGTHSTFLETMLAGLSSHRLDSDRRPLQRLTTRSPDDPSIALLDGWAIVADVLTFYQERIANEGYLLTATERRSILELARLMGHRLRPGVAAGVYLALTLEQGYEIEVPAGTRAQSVPDPGTLPVVFETTEPLPARTSWNAIPARQTRPSFLQPSATFTGTRTFHARGVVTNMKPNDTVLFGCGDVQQPYTIQTVTADADAGTTRVTYLPFRAASSDGTPDNGGPQLAANGGTRGPALTRLAAVVEALRKDPSLPPASRFQLARSPERTYNAAADLGPQLLTRLDPRLEATLYAAYAGAPVTARPEGLCHVEAMRVRAAPFGHNAPQELVYRDNVLVGRREWALAELGGTARLNLTSTDVEQTVVAAFEGHHDLATTVNPLRIEAALDYGTGVFGPSGTVDLRDLIEPDRDPFGEDDPVFTTSLTLDQDGAHVVEVRVAYEGSFSEGAYDDARLLHVDLTFKGPSGHATSVRILPSEPIIDVAATGRLRVSVDDDPLRQISFNNPIVETIGNRTVTISLDGGLEVSHRTPGLATEEQFRTVSLDTIYDKITAGGRIVVDRLDHAHEVFTVERVRTVSRADYGISARVTQLVLHRPWLTSDDTSLAVLRATTVHAQSEQLELAEEPIEGDVAGDEIELDGLYDGLQAGRWLVVTGERSDVRGAGGQPVEGVDGSELVMLAGVVHDVQTVEDADGDEIELPTDTLHTRLLLSEPLAYSYKRDAVRINANVVAATHGETRTEVLGGGDGTRGSQQFTLKQRPLTFVPATTPEGVESTLDVRVDDVRWPEHETLSRLHGRERGYETRTDDDGTVTVVFGDGTHGTRLPTGVENVTAVYRSGTGRTGNVAAGRISVLATRPLGVKAVVNPQRASGGADPESRDQARRTVALGVLALDRLVSVQDYAGYTRIFAGIGKAAAVRLSDGRRQIVHLTIAGAADAPVDPGSDLYRNLLLALDRFGDPNVALRVALREAVFLVLSARVKVLDDHLWDDVEPRIRAALLDTFGFDRRELGQDVQLSEAISVIQGIDGIDYVDVDLLDGISETEARDPEALAAKLGALATAAGAKAPPDTTGEADARPRQHLVVEPARIDPAVTDPALRVRPAQLAYLNPELPDTLILTEVTS